MSKPDHTTREEVRRHFDFFDDDKNGFIDIDEFSDMLGIMGIDETDAAAAEMFARVDTNCDGRVSFEEFFNWWRSTWGDH